MRLKSEEQINYDLQFLFLPASMVNTSTKATCKYCSIIFGCNLNLSCHYFL